MEYKKIQSWTFIGTLVGITLLFGWMLQPYIFPVFWAAVIAALFQPVYKWILSKTGKRTSVAAGLTMGIIVLVLLIPVAGIISLIAQQAYVVYRDFGNQASFETISTTIEGYLDWPILQQVLSEIDIKETLSSWGSNISKFVYQFAASSGQNTARLFIQFFIMLYTLFYFLKDGKVLLLKLMHLVPLGDKYEKELYTRFVSTAKATLKGTLLIGAIQGVIGGLALIITGVPAAAFWGVIMVVLSIIPGIGAIIILLPAAVILFLSGSIWQGVVVVIATIIASVIDNVLRGPLVGKDAQMHPLLIFFATLGGLLSFGLSGVVIGPVITAFFLSMWNIYEQKYKAELEKDD